MNNKISKVINFIHRDIKEFNIIIIVLISLILISISGYSSYAIFSDQIESDKLLIGTINKNNTPNAPLLSANMIPVYYDEINNVWRKADSSNNNNSYKWYDYDAKMWANAVTVSAEHSYETGEYEYKQSITTNNSVSLNPAVEYSEQSTYSSVVDFYEALTYCVGSSYSFDKKTGKYTVNGTYLSGSTSFAGKYGCEDSCTCTNMTYASSYSRQTVGIGNRKVYRYSGREYSATSANKGKYAATSFTFDKNTGKYTLTNPTLRIYSSSYINYYTCNSETETSCSTMYKIKTVSTNTVTAADKYTSTKEKIVTYENELNLVDGTKKSCSNSKCTRNDYVNASLGTEIPMSTINAMYVWIPRYKYIHFNAGTPQRVRVLFESGTNSTGTIECNDSISASSGKSQNCTDNTNGKTISNRSTYTHPAFTFGNKELTGIWVGKFESSGVNNITIKPDIQSTRSMSISTMFQYARNMELANNEYGFPQSGTTLDTYTGEISGDSNNLDTHMMKNMEWGAAAYLSHSKYGMNGEVYINNSSSYYTGRSGGNVGGKTSIKDVYTNQTSTTQYNTYGFYTYDGYLLNYNTNNKSTTRDLSKVASTTGNIYGIYDMSGGSFDYIMGNMQNSSNAFYPSNAGTWSATNKPSDKYYDKYSYGSYSTNAKIGKLGDATTETNPGGMASSWYQDTYYPVNSSSSWPHRGGYYNSGTSAGLFYTSARIGNGDSSYSYRVALSITK